MEQFEDVEPGKDKEKVKIGSENLEKRNGEQVWEGDLKQYAMWIQNMNPEQESEGECWVRKRRWIESSKLNAEKARKDEWRSSKRR